MTAVRSERATYEPGQLPAPLTPLLGRERELAALRDLLLEDDVRVVTLLGPGGVGKTRLAIEVAARVATDIEPAPVFVAASHLHTGNELLNEIARLLDIREGPGVTIATALAEAIGGDPLLLVLDNLEQIAEAGRALAPLLTTCPGLLLLVTSRVPLHIAGERRFPVTPLPIETSTGEAATAVELFVARVRALKPDFILTRTEREVATAICRRLDGLPLAIELAAARCTILSPAALLARLTNHLGVLRGKRADLPERQQTLNAVVAWSYALLPAGARLAFRRLSVIPGDFTLEIAQWMLAGAHPAAQSSLPASSTTTSPLPETLDVLDVIAQLVEHSLLERRDDGGTEPRFWMLQTIRDAGRVLAAETGELEDTRDRFAAFMLAQAESFRAGLASDEAGHWRERCAAEHALLIVAIERLHESGDKAGATTLAGALWRFWYTSGSLSEGKDLLERVLALPGEVAPAALAHALNGLGALLLSLSDLDGAAERFRAASRAFAGAGDEPGHASAENNLALVRVEQGRYAEAVTAYESAIATFEALGETRRLAAAFDNLGLVRKLMGDIETAIDLHARALAFHRAAGDASAIAKASNHLAIACLGQGDLDAAERYAETSHELWLNLGETFQVANVLTTLGNIAVKRGELARSTRWHEEALAQWRAREDTSGIALALHNLACNAIRQGNLERARDQLRESLVIRLRRGDPEDLAYSFAAFTSLAQEAGDPVRATKLTAAVAAYRAATGLPEDDTDARPELRRALGKARFDAAWKAGQALDLPAILAEVELISMTGTAAESPRQARLVATVAPIAPVTDHGLTDRELDVLRQIATGKSNAEIGAALFISPFTAKTHVANVLGKLGVETRAAASTWAAQHGLLAGG